MTHIGDALLVRMTPGNDEHPNPALHADWGASSIQPGEAQLLYGLVRALRPKTVVEIGAGYGYSTLHLAGGCKDNGAGFVYSVEVDAKRLAGAAHNLADADLTSWAAIIDDLPDFLHDIDLAFVDAVHTPQAVALYLSFLVPRLAGDGIIVVHDPLLNHCLSEALRLPAFARLRSLTLTHTSRYGLAILGRTDEHRS